MFVIVFSGHSYTFSLDCGQSLASVKCHPTGWKKLIYGANSSDIAQSIPLPSISKATSCEHNFQSEECSSPVLLYLFMLFILELTCTVSSAGQLKNK